MTLLYLAFSSFTLGALAILIGIYLESNRYEKMGGHFIPLGMALFMWGLLMLLLLWKEFTV